MKSLASRWAGWIPPLCVLLLGTPMLAEIIVPKDVPERARDLQDAPV